jgi:hypothetical protein
MAATVLRDRFRFRFPEPLSRSAAGVSGGSGAAGRSIRCACMASAKMGLEIAIVIPRQGRIVEVTSVRLESWAAGFGPMLGRTVAFGEHKRMDESAYDAVIPTARPKGLGDHWAHA